MMQVTTSTDRFLAAATDLRRDVSRIKEAERRIVWLQRQSDNRPLAIHLCLVEEEIEELRGLYVRARTGLGKAALLYSEELRALVAALCDVIAEQAAKEPINLTKT